MALKTKQYLENSWYRWASQDRQTWYAAQYQYWYGVNTRDMKNWVCLAWWATDVVKNITSPFSYFTYLWDLYYVTAAWKIYTAAWVQKCNTWVTHTDDQWNPVAPNWIEFWNNIYIVWAGWIVRVDGTWTATPLTSYIPEYPDNSWSHYRNNWCCVLNYANTFLLIWDKNVVWKMEVVLWTETFTGIRYFESSYNVYWLTQEWNYLKIYTSNWINTKIHYAKGTFDVEYTWLVQTVSFKWLALAWWDVASDQWYDYVIFTVKSWEYKLAKVQWYSKVDIRWTQTWWTQKVFTATDPNIKSADWVLFAAMEDWIWTFIEYNWWLWWWCCEFPIASTESVTTMYKYWEYLYVCVKANNKYTVRYYDMSFHPATYQPNGYIISRVFDWGCWSLFKKNVQATVTYNMPVWTNMELSYRYDRSSFEYDKSNFLSIKKLTDNVECYDIVFPTTPSTSTQDLLALEDWYNILLENGNNILLEDLMICPFNKTWNYLEYRVDFTWYLDEDTNKVIKTPILFEHSLLYDDRIRKYR